MTDSEEDVPRPEWDPLLAQQLVGSIVLIGLTFCDPSGEVERQEQLHGVVVEADPRNGFLVKLGGAREGDDYWLPPHPSAFHPALPGKYEVVTTGEVIENPDFMSTWTIHRPADS